MVIYIETSLFLKIMVMKIEIHLLFFKCDIDKAPDFNIEGEIYT